MKLRKPRYQCEHGLYDRHESYTGIDCPGGVFLPDDTLVIERPEGMGDAEWISTCEYIKGMSLLSVREAE